MARNKGGGGTNIHVTPGEKGWNVKPEKKAPVSHHKTQAEAEKAAKDLARQLGGGEVVTHRPDGSIRDKDTISKTDPNPPKDTRH